MIICIVMNNNINIINVYINENIIILLILMKWINMCNNDNV